MTDARLVLHQSRYDIRIFVRDPAATFFTLALPVVFLVLFVTIFGSQTLDSGVEITTFYVPGIVALAVGAAAFSALGIAITSAIPTEAAAPAVANAVSLPLFFISGIFVPAESIPEWLLSIADVFPLKPFADALFNAIDPATSGLGLAWADLAVVALWGAAAAFLAARTFRWIPRRG